MAGGFEITEDGGKATLVINNGKGDTATMTLPGGMSDDQLIGLARQLMREYRTGKRKFPEQGKTQIGHYTDAQVQDMSATELAAALDDA